MPPDPGVPRDKLLFTPGPLTTSRAVKEAMLRDAGSWHVEFNDLVRSIRGRLLSLAGVTKDGGYETVLMQGSGSFGVEAAVTSAVPRDGRLLALANGAYGERIIQMARTAGIDAVPLRKPEDTPPGASAVADALDADASITTVAAVHCETTTGILNRIEAIGCAVKERGRTYVVDAMSSFGAIPIDMKGTGIDYLVSSANKCLQGVPGFSFAIVRRSALERAEGNARSLSLDLAAQWRGFEKNGQFRYTPPTHAILAFDAALRELDEEGGVEARGARYRRNHEALLAGMRDLGFQPYLPPDVQSFVITSFPYPRHPAFDFDAFYRKLSDRGMIIYPGKLTDVDCFRIGTIGHIFEDDVLALVDAIAASLDEMGCLPIDG